MAYCSDSKGAVLPIFAVSILGLLSIVSLTIDASSRYVEKRHGQNVADTAAYAAAVDLMKGAIEEARVSAKEICRRNGYDNNRSTNECQVNIPPHAGEHVGDDKFAEVVLWKTTPTYFSKVFFGDSSRVGARGVAGDTSQAASGVGLLVLNRTADKALWYYNKNNKVTVTNASVVVNSDSDLAVFGRTGGTLKAPAVEIHGEADLDGGAVINAPVYNEHAKIHLDPYRDLGRPAECDDPTVPYRGSIRHTTNTNLVLEPGRYRNIVATGGMINLKPGIYCILDDPATTNGTDNSKEGHLELRNDSALRLFVKYYSAHTTETWTPGANLSVPLAAPGGVFIYLDRTFQMVQTSSAILRAPTTGKYQGILIYQARNSSAGEIVDLAGQGHLSLTGTLYAPSPNSLFRLKQDVLGAATLSQVIVNRAEFRGSVELRIDWREDEVGHVQKPVLVE